MIVSNLIFFGDVFHKRLYAQKNTFAPTKENVPRVQPYLMITMLVFFTVQLLLPLRHLAYSGNTMVTELGYRFGWRVMLLEKAGIATFTLRDKADDRYMEIDNRQYLTEFQEKQMAIQPDFMVQFAQHIAARNSDIVKSSAVSVASFITINGRVSQRFIQQDLDLLQVQDDWSDKPWIIYRSVK
jgi:hypothetical protein